METENTAASEAQNAPMTVRDVIKQLLHTDLDATATFSFNNSDPIPITDVEENDESQVIFSG